MLKTLRLQNFKGFRDQRIEFMDFSVVIGRNNAGKSSAFEAIRILSNVLAKLPSGRFTSRPAWVAGDGVGFLPPIDDQQRKPETLFFRYSDPPATIEAIFSNGSKVEVFIGTGGVLYAEAFTRNDRMVDSRSRAKECEFPPIAILPQIRPLEDYERVLRADYVRKCIDSHLSSRHFRNQIRYFEQHFESFRDLFQQTWQGIRVSEFNSFDAAYDDELELLLTDDGFVAEAANFGHGLQMWLQIIWFIARTPCESVVVLDEPDVYMHPEQQSKMTYLLRERFRQCLISTHSEQIINACDSDELLRLHRNLTISKHGVSQSQYDAELDQPAPSLQLKNAAASEYVAKIVLFQESQFTLKNGAGNVVLSIICRKDGEVHEIELAADRYQVMMQSPQNIELYLDGESRRYEGSSNAERVEFIVDLTG